MKDKPSDHEKHLTRRFRENPQNAIDYLNTCLEDKDPRVFLLALQDVAKAFGGMTQLAKKSGITREHLYTTLSEKGNPAFFNLNKVLSALDFKMEIKPKKNPQVRRKIKQPAA